MSNNINDFISAKLAENEGKQVTIPKQWFEDVIVYNIELVTDTLEVIYVVDPKNGELGEIRHPLSWMLNKPVTVGDIITGGWKSVEGGRALDITPTGKWSA